MLNKQRLLTWFSLLIIASMLLAACGGPATQPPAEEPPRFSHPSNGRPGLS